MAVFEPKQFGKYYLLEKLAVGGMAEIYKAKTYGAEGFEKLLAIKRILPHAAADKEFIDMLIDEAKLSVLLSHANIVQVYDLGKVGTDYFISMEFIHGVNLRDILYNLREKNKKMPTDLAVYVASEVCKGLDYAHRKTDSNNQPLSLVHRDISPQNILISFEGEVKIVDFGIAKAAMNISHTMAGILKGKIAYMSPEQAMGKAIDARTDIFSLGILLYEALTGKKLYTGESQFEVLKKIRTTRIDASKLPESIPEPVKPILAKALAYRPEERYVSASDMQIALTKYLYANFTGFSPRKLAQFVKEQFQQEIKKDKVAGESEGDVQTGSVSLLQGATQENLVHRETTPAKSIGKTGPGPAEETRPVITGKSITISENIVSAKKRPMPMLPLLSIALLGGIGFFAWKFFSTQKPPAVSAVAGGTLQISSTPSGADIFLDGKQTAHKTPAILDDLKLNQDYTVALFLEKYGRQEKTVRLNNTEPLPLDIVFAKNFGLLNIISDPSGAAILVDGIATGKITPANLDALVLNTEYRITLSKPEHQDFEQRVTLANATPQKLLASLKPIEPIIPTLPIAPPPAPPPPVVKMPELKEKIIKITKPPVEKPIEKPVVEKPVASPPEVKPAPTGGEGSIQVTSSPSGADIFMNGERQGSTPMTLKTKSGSVKILITKGDDKLPCKQTVQVRPGETASVHCSMGELYGKIDVNSSPPRAEVYFDGKKINGKTPLTIQKIKRDREHTIRLELGGYKAWERAFDLEERESKAFNVELER